MKYATDRPYADPEAAARKLLEIANVAALPMKRGKSVDFTGSTPFALMVLEAVLNGQRYGLSIRPLHSADGE
ncbi:hypothetical protein JQ597_06195 [Bradyrhizobium sp. AUGA SZCCT0177]|uniref:hypothetical protein n=1 Tax=unclassified Bradyrhizobium TaxID=2631580 RepID=UPI001BAA8E30|nr:MULTISPECIES: hypothetical protein [unclassified Bradyrhizobium]MBR1236962.1 hypothetical protein [Bradyrhizobium sp. AUGA SZCCT0182]MBR1281621.1 hypothetical protein [Bradyrhizobium sp. AUGA SZCCT0177]